MTRITVNGIGYDAVDIENERMMIVCVDNRGLMFVGRVNIEDKKQFITIHDARCIIYWGTTKHIAELCNGPTSKTRLGAMHDIIVPKHKIAFAYDTTAEAWA